MTIKFRLMTANETGEVIINELFEDYDEAETEYDKQVLNNDTKEVILDEVFFDKDNVWLEDNDNGILAWREEGY